MSAVLWICQALSLPKQRYICTPGHVLMGGDRYQGFDVYNVPLVHGIYPSFAKGKGVNSRTITHECLHVYMYMVYMYFRRQFEAVPAYVMSQRWLRTPVFVTMPVKGAPRIKNLLSQLSISTPSLLSLTCVR